MKNLLKVCFFLSIGFLGSCSKETSIDLPVEGEVSSSTYYVIDWATGREVGTLEEVASDRSAATYANNMSGATTKYSYFGKFYQNGELIATSPTYWKDANFNGFLLFTGNDEFDCRIDMTYGRKVPSVPCTLTIFWSTNEGTVGTPETFTIGPSGTVKTYLFPSAL